MKLDELIKEIQGLKEKERQLECLKKANEKRAIPIFYNGVKYNSIREASRKLGVCQWNIKKNGEIINE